MDLVLSSTTPSRANQASNLKNEASTGTSTERQNFGKFGWVRGLLAIVLAQAGVSSAFTGIFCTTSEELGEGAALAVLIGVTETGTVLVRGG